jgi:hypothetical protein
MLPDASGAQLSHTNSSSYHDDNSSLGQHRSLTDSDHLSDSEHEIELDDSTFDARSTASVSSTSIASSGAELAPINWRKGGIIGSGSYGSVYLGLNTDTGTLIAVKQVFLGDSADNPSEVDSIIREVEILRSLSHPAIVQYLGVSREQKVCTTYLPTYLLLAVVGVPINMSNVRWYNHTSCVLVILSLSISQPLTYSLSISLTHSLSISLYLSLLDAPFSCTCH